MDASPKCMRCGKQPAEIEEYIEASAEENRTPDDYVRRSEGTYNLLTNTFACTDCYIEMGMPTAPPPGWKAS